MFLGSETLYLLLSTCIEPLFWILIIPLLIHVIVVLLSLSAAQQSIHEAVYLKLDTSVDLGKLATSEGVIANARVAETVDALEQLTAGWCQQIEQVKK